MQAREPSTSTSPTERLERLALRDYEPRSTLRLPRSKLREGDRGIYDFHTHLGRWLTPDTDWVASDLAGEHGAPWACEPGAMLEAMDRIGVAACVNLDGRWDGELEANLDRYDRAYPGRFFTFCQLDWSASATRPEIADELVASLRSSKAAGARGLKIWKTLGLGVRDGGGELLLPGDPRLRPVFDAAGELELPVLIHTADPVAFFDPVDPRNERLEELLAHPEWSFAARGMPSHGRLMESFEELVAAHPETTFVGAHVAGNVEDLAWVSRMLNRYPNLHVDLAARVSDLGRQPRAARRLFCEHPARILVGSDQVPPDPTALRPIIRFLETDDECYPYSDEHPPPSGRWTISALDLPGEVLRAVYSDNARRLLGVGEE